jgi:hypothetical protein
MATRGAHGARSSSHPQNGADTVPDTPRDAVATPMSAGRHPNPDKRYDATGTTQAADAKMCR